MANIMYLVDIAAREVHLVEIGKDAEPHGCDLGQITGARSVNAAQVAALLDEADEERRHVRAPCWPSEEES